MTRKYTISDNHLQDNPLIQPFGMPYGAIPFDKIILEHYLPAFRYAIDRQNNEIEAILSCSELPTFHNTIEALEESGRLLSILTLLFFNLNSAETNEQMQTLAEDISAMLTGHANDISLNIDLFHRVKTVYEHKAELSLTTEQQTLLQKTYDSFTGNGANLNEEEKATYRELTEKLDIASLAFDKHLLSEMNEYQLFISNKELLDGLSEDFLETAAAKAKQKEKTGWILDLTAPSYIPAMKFLHNRELRQTLYIAYTTRCTHNNDHDNKELIVHIVNLRLKLANLLGYKNYADYALKDRMAENSNNVYTLLHDLLRAYKPHAEEEVRRVEDFARNHGLSDKLQPWDWAYYAEQLKDEAYNFNEDVLRPYFELTRVISGVFGLATKLYGITFKEIANVPVYHPEVQVFEVNDQHGRFLALLYTDFYPRPGKRSGAWMTEFRAQWKENDKDIRPHISLVMNFTRPTPSKPALLTFDEVNTFLHEFGHALHGMLSDVTYASLSGTNVPRDFVECPSQFMENYLVEKEFLDDFAIHYATGEKIPEELLQKLKAARNYNVGYACIRQLGFGLLDIQWHLIESPFNGNVLQAEKETGKITTLIESPADSSISPSFSHIFSGGYAAGYYSYKWSEVLAADSYAAFQEHGIFDADTAHSFREYVLSKGGTDKPMTLYKKFRKKEPSIKALLTANEIVLPADTNQNENL